MSNIYIVANGIYLPEKQVGNSELEKELKLENGYIEKRTGIKNRYYAIHEKIEEMALEAVKQMITETSQKEEIGLVITATTSTNILMPGISNYVQKQLGLSPCICLDILAGCAGYINAFDIARNYIVLNKVNTALIVGVESLSKIIDDKDFSTAILLGDGAGATIISKTNENRF